MADYRYVILGGGVAAGYAAKELVNRGVGGDLCLVSQEDQPPYDRPPLSKSVLKGESGTSDAAIEDESYYEEHGIDLRLGSRVEEVDFAMRRLSTPDHKIGFEKLLIATGGRARRLEIPGADLPGVLYLRTSEHAGRILDESKGAERAVVIGGGFIGTEVSASLTERGVNVTLVYPSDHLLEGKPLTPEMSSYFEKYFRKQGVKLMAGRRPASFEGDDHVTGVTLESDGKLDADFVVVGVGVIPNTEPFESTSLKLDDGVVVDEQLETNIDGVFAAGDVARYPDHRYDRMRRIEHWDVARRQGAHAARGMMGEKVPYSEIPYFFSDVFDLSWEYWGDRARADRVVYRGSLEDGSFSAWWLRGKQVEAAFVMDRPTEEREAAQRLVTDAAEVDETALADESKPLPS